jgi:hypothetical protein
MSSYDDDVLPLPLPPLPTRQTDAVKEIMAKVVSTKSAVLYAQQNSIFVLFCYETADHLRDLLLEPWFIEGLNACESATQKKKYAKNCCLDMSPDDDNCPFILSNLTFVIFSDFVTQRKARKGKSRGKSMCLGNSSLRTVPECVEASFQDEQLYYGAEFFR